MEVQCLFEIMVSVLAFIESHIANLPELMRQMLDAADIRPVSRGGVGKEILLPRFAQALEHGFDAGNVIGVNPGRLLLPFHDCLPP